MHIAVGGFQHETNTFSPGLTTWSDFAQADTWPGLLQGDALFAAMKGKNIPISGFIEAARAAGEDLHPLAWSAAGPGGTVSQEAYEEMSERIIGQLKALRTVDAVYLDLHGAMVTTHLMDGEGELLRRVREVVGLQMPVVASLDLHANVSEAMLEGTDVLVAYRTYPHVDMAETGARVFALLRDRCRRGRRWPWAWRRVPFLIPLCWQGTDHGPAKAIYGALRATRPATVASLSLAMGFPAADTPFCGPAVWAYADSQQEASDLAGRIQEDVCAAESQFDGPILTPQDAAEAALKAVQSTAGPVVIADAQDNPGAGGSSDTMGLIRALVESRVPEAVCGLVADPQAVAAAWRAGVGATLHCRLGGRSGIPGDEPLAADFVVERLHDGQVRATGAVFRGYELQLGPSACLRLGGVHIIVTSRKIQLLDLSLIRFMGFVPERQRIIAVKSTVHFRADFAPIASRILVCAAPGAFPLDPSQLPWRHLNEGMRLRPGGPVFHRAL
ncbi:hypothetical protein CDEF62S_06302 [Castellaniella defragrans]